MIIYDNIWYSSASSPSPWSSPQCCNWTCQLPKPQKNTSLQRRVDQTLTGKVKHGDPCSWTWLVPRLWWKAHVKWSQVYISVPNSKSKYTAVTDNRSVTLPWESRSWTPIAPDHGGHEKCFMAPILCLCQSFHRESEKNGGPPCRNTIWSCIASRSDFGFWRLSDPGARSIMGSTNIGRKESRQMRQFVALWSFGSYSSIQNCMGMSVHNSLIWYTYNIYDIYNIYRIQYTYIHIIHIIHIYHKYI